MRRSQPTSVYLAMKRNRTPQPSVPTIRSVRTEQLGAITGGGDKPASVWVAYGAPVTPNLMQLIQ